MIKLLLIIFLFTFPVHAFADSYTFDGVNDEIDWGDVNNTTTGNRTECGWFKMTEDALADVLVGKKNVGSDASAGYMIFTDTSDVVYFKVGDGTDVLISTATTDIDGSWKMVCGVWTSDENTYIYVNGIQEDTDVGAGSIDSLTNAVEFAVGENGNEAGDATMSAGWITTANNAWSLIEINEIRWHPEGRFAAAGPGATGMIVPAWLGATTELDIANSIDGVPSNAVANTDGPPIMIGALGASY